MLTCGELIRSIRTQKQKTLAQLARYCSISVPYASDMERDRRIPTDEKLKQIAEFLDTDYGQLQKARDMDRGFVSICLDNQPEYKKELITCFASCFTKLTKKEAQDIISMLGKKNAS